MKGTKEMNANWYCVLAKGTFPVKQFVFFQYKKRNEK